MLHTFGKICGGAMAMLCLIATLAIAQGGLQGQEMICMKDDGKGQCTAAAGADGRVIVVVGDNLQRGDRMLCVDRGNVVHCTEFVGR